MSNLDTNILDIDAKGPNTEVPQLANAVSTRFECDEGFDQTIELHLQFVYGTDHPSFINQNHLIYLISQTRS